jgi:hypothetical protein
MTVDVRDLLPLYALGAVDEAERRAVDAAIALDPSLAAELASYQDAASLVGSMAPAVAPPKYLKARLMTTIGGGRFEPRVSRFAQIFDVAIDKAREMLGWIDTPARWVPSGLPGINAVHFAAGPACKGADTGYLELQPGAVFAYHEHLGEEITLVLAGEAVTTDGKHHVAGDEILMQAGTSHDFRAVGDTPLVVAVRAFGVRYGVVKPNDD